VTGSHTAGVNFAQRRNVDPGTVPFLRFSCGLGIGTVASKASV
jgi:hypothetical protein